jgi:hypothetical protein
MTEPIVYIVERLEGETLTVIGVLLSNQELIKFCSEYGAHEQFKITGIVSGIANAWANLTQLKLEMDTMDGN